MRLRKKKLAGGLAEAADARAYPPPGQMVDVGGYRLHLNCTGSGSPTVVIDAGWGDWSAMWSWVQPEVAKTTRVCTYDRAGMGYSEAGPLPRNARQFAQELHTLLQPIFRCLPAAAVEAIRKMVEQLR